MCVHVLDSPGCGAINKCTTNCAYPKDFLMTPGFPSYYQPNDTCLWKIRGTFGKFIKFNFISLDVINGDSSCENSYVQIFELDSLNKKRSLGRFCKENWPYEVFTSNWQKLDIEFEASTVRTDKTKIKDNCRKYNNLGKYPVKNRHGKTESDNLLVLISSI